MRAQHRRGMQLLAVTLLVVSLFTLLRTPLTITGYATFGSQQEVLGEVQAFAERFTPLAFAGQGSTLCILIDLGFGNSYAYTIEKAVEDVIITPVRESSCAGDFVLKFVNYEQFKTFAADPTCRSLLAGGRGQQFWYLPGNLWPPGDAPTCNAEFQQKYCPALYYCGEPAALSSALSCCSKEQLTPAQLATAKSAAQSGAAANQRPAKSAVLESPLANVRPFLAWGLGVLIVVALIIGAMLLMHRGKQERGESTEDQAISTIRSYIQATRAQGFSDAEIAHELRDRGWNEDMIEANLK